MYHMHLSILPITPSKKAQDTRDNPILRNAVHVLLQPIRER